jgi:anti-sigma-K factor RskA
MSTDTGTIDHDALRELLAAYAIGALSPDERVLVETHVRGCAECAKELASFMPVSSALARSVPQLDPPPMLRTKILLAIGAPRETRQKRTSAAVWVPWLAAAAMLVAAVGAAWYAAGLRQRVRSLEVQLQAALDRAADGERRVNVVLRAQADSEELLTVLAAPDVRRIDLAGQQVAPRASARAFWSRSRGVVLTAANLPPLAPGRTYQLWFVTSAAKVSVGLVRPDANGAVRSFVDRRGNLPEPAALAVTEEPDGGVPQPTGAMYLVGAAH